MSELNIDLKNEEWDQYPAVRIRFRGVLGEQSAVQVQACVAHPLLQPGKNLVFDLAGLTHISEFGMGILIATLVSLHRDHPRIIIEQAPISIRPKIEALPFPVIWGMEPDLRTGPANHGRILFKIDQRHIASGVPFTADLEMLDEHGRSLAGSWPTHLGTDKGIISPTLLTEWHDGKWHGEIYVTSSGPVRLRAWNDQARGELEIRVEKSGTEIDFPREIQCPGCQRYHMAGKADVYRCVKCNQMHFVDDLGHVIPLRPGCILVPGFAKRIEFSIPGDVNYLNYVRNFFVGIAREENFDEEKVSQIEMALDEALANVIEHAYKFDCHQDIAIHLHIYSDKIEIIIRDHGRSFDYAHTPLPDIHDHIEKRKVDGLGRYLMSTLMDEVRYTSDAYTNELRMIKRI